MTLAAIPRLIWPFRLQQHVSQICCAESAFENLLNQMEIDSHIIDDTGYGPSTPGKAGAHGADGGFHGDEYDDGYGGGGMNTMMENNLAYTGTMIAGVHTMVYNSIKSRGVYKSGGTISAAERGDRGQGKIDVMDVLASCNVYVFDLDACKLTSSPQSGNASTEIQRVLTGNSFESLYKCMNLLMRPNAPVPSTATSGLTMSSSNAAATGSSTSIAGELPKLVSMPHSLEQTDNRVITHNAAANEIVERSFHAFIAELFLYALPKTLLYYPRQQIVACNIERLLSLLNGTARAICSVVVDTSAFIDLLRRHGVALELENAIIDEQS